MIWSSVGIWSFLQADLWQTPGPSLPSLLEPRASVLFFSLFYILEFGTRLMVMDRVPSLQGVIEPLPSHPEALGPEVSPAETQLWMPWGRETVPSSHPQHLPDGHVSL